MLSFFLDRTGFPVVQVPGTGVAVHLFPVTKLQIEAFVAEANEFQDSWYEGLLSLNPRRSWRNFETQHREELFATGMFPREAAAFAGWLGSEFRLPTVDQWQSVFRQWSETVFKQEDRNALFNRLEQSTPAGQTLRVLLPDGRRGTLAELALMRHGLLEWVHEGNDWKGIGEPRDRFCQQLFSWRAPVRPISQQRRLREFGFRLVVR